MTTKLTVAPTLAARWREGALEIALEGGGRSLRTPEPSIVTLLHAFAAPADPAAVAEGDPDRQRMIAELTRAGFLVPAEAAAPAVPATTLAATVIMPTYEKPAYLDLSLASYRGQSFPAADYEIIVIDDGGSAATAAVAAKHESHIPMRFLRRPHGGRAAARNAGLAEARGRVVIFADDDCIASPGFVAAHVRAHERSAAPRIVLGWLNAVVSLLDQKLIGPLFPALRHKLEGGFAPIVPLLAGDALEGAFERAVAELAMPEPDYQRKVAPAVAAYGDALEGLEVAWFLGFTSNMSAPLALVRQVGAFDPGYVGYGMEDTDLTYALWQAGARVGVEREAASYHQVHSRSTVGNEMGETLRYFCKKHDNLDAMLFAHWFLGSLDLAAANAIAIRARDNADDEVLVALVGMLRDTLVSRLAV